MKNEELVRKVLKLEQQMSELQLKYDSLLFAMAYQLDKLDLTDGDNKGVSRQ